MVSTPKTSNTPPNEPNSKVNIMSSYQDFGQYIDTSSIDNSQEKSGMMENYYNLFDFLTGNDLLFQDDIISPTMLTSSVTTPSLVVDGMSTPRELNDSPLFNNPSYVASPSLEPPRGFFPDLPPAVTTATSSLIQQMSIAPSVTIPVDDSLPLTTIHGNSSPSLNIPWNTETTNPSTTDDLSPYMSNYSTVNSPKSASFMSISSAVGSPKSTSFMSISSTVDTPESSFIAETQSSPAMVSSPSSTTTVKPTTTKLGTRHRKRSIGEIGKDSTEAVDELALKRAKNTDAARRSRLRKLMKMEGLEKQVTELKKENTDLQTRIAVLESEKKGLEDKNAEKDERVKMLEQQLSEAHERLIKRS